MHDTPEPPHPLDVATAAIVSWTAASTQIVDHMRRAPTAPSDSQITATLTHLVRGTLGEVADRYAQEDVEIGARFAAEAIDVLMREILLVDHDAYGPPPRNRAERRRRGNRR